jgi:spore maturation protein CgeB
MYSRAKITLGFSAVGDARPGTERLVQVRLRDFEAPMSGAFYLVEYIPELEEFFEPGKEIACYTDPEDLVAKARYYLEHDDEREKIRQAGYKRAVSEHTWQKRLEKSLIAMGFTS